MWNKPKVILLASNQEVNSLYGYKDKSLLFNYNKDGYNKLEAEKEFTQHFHLYIISDDVIKLSDNNEGWFLRTHSSINSVDVIQNPIFTSKYRYNKIIATTNKSLGITNHRVSPVPNFCDFPQIPQSFIEQYITEYNQGKIISDVLVEYDCDHNQMPNKVIDIVKINQDNSINIKTVKDSFSREEVVELLESLKQDIPSDYSFNLKEWIEQNL